MSVVFFSDIDDIFVQTKPKCAEAYELSVGVYDKTGNPKTFFNLQQRYLIAVFGQHLFIPVTGRNNDALEQVKSPMKLRRLFR